MTRQNQFIDMNSPELACKKMKKCFKTEKRALDVMIKGYQEMADINLKISKLCFEVESEADRICIRLTECE